MAMTFSPATPVRTIFQRKSLSPGGCYCRGPGYEKCHLNIGIAFTLRSAEYSGKLIVAKRNFQKRTGIFRCATIEEIEAEKSSIEKDVKERMEKTIETVRTNFNSIRTGRANPAILDRVEVEYYGTPVSLKSIAQISTPDSASLLVQPYDKSSLKVIEKAIVSSDLGLTPNNDGEVGVVKVVAKQTEEGKVALRNIRRDALKAYEKLEKDKKLSEDNVKDLSSDLQKLIDEYMKKIETIYKQKEKELLKV
ncbi:hypothetical protein AAG906_018482 [Vitis piasezkii]